MKLSEWILNYNGILARVARKYIVEEVVQLEAENEAWFELCRVFVGGGDKHILEMRSIYLLTGEESET